jgi:hypothetical protein
VCTAAGVAPVTIAGAYLNLENRGINSLGFTSGPFLRFGAVSVTPDGSAGTTGLATPTRRAACKSRSGSASSLAAEPETSSSACRRCWAWR